MKTRYRKLICICISGIIWLAVTQPNAKAQICSVNAGLDKSICITQQPLLLNGTAGSGQSSPPEYTWIKLAGPSAIIASPNALTTTVSGLTPGNYVFQLSNKCLDGFYAKDMVAVTVLPEPPTALAGPDLSFCYNDTVHLSANTVNEPCTGNWTVSPPGGNFFPNANDPHALYMALPVPGVRKFAWTISNGACQTTDTVKVSFAETAVPVSAGEDDTLSCKGKCVVLDGSYPGYAPQHGLWTIISAPNTPNFSDPASPNSKVCNLEPGDYRFRWTVSGPCIHDSDDVSFHIVNVKEPPVSFGDMLYNNFCGDPPVTSQVLTGAPSIIGDVVSWQQISGGSVAIFSPDNHQASVLVENLTGTFPYVFTFTQTNADGCTFVTTHTVYRSQYITGLTNPADQELPCDVTGTSFDISFDKINLNSGNVTRKAVFVSGPVDTARIRFTGSVVTDSSITDTWTLSELSAIGTYVYRMDYSNACGSASQDISITVSRTPGTVNAGSDIVLPCGSISVSAVGSANSPGIYSWTQMAGPSGIVLPAEATLIPTLPDLVEGIYSVQLSNWGGNACPVKTDNMNITVTQLPPAIAYINSDTSICAGNYQLSANVPLPVETGAWSVTPSDGITFYPDSTKPAAIATGLLPNSVYAFTWTVSNACGTVEATQEVRTGEFYSPPIPDAGVDLCEDLGTVNVTLSGNDAGTASILWTPLTPGSSVNSTNTQVTQASFNGGSGSYLFEYALNTPGCATLKDIVKVTINSDLTINAGNDIIVCAAELPASANLNATVFHPTSLFLAVWSQLAGPSTASISSRTSPNATVTNLVPGVYQFEYRQVPGNGCQFISDTVVVIVKEQPSESSAGPDQVVCNATTATVFTLAGEAPVTGTGYWETVSTPPGSSAVVLSDIHSPTCGISNLGEGIYHLRWTVSNGTGCPANSDDMKIQVHASASAGPNLAGCNAANIQLTGNSNTNGAWSLVSGPATVVITPNSGNTATVSGLISPVGPLVYTFQFTLQDSGFCAGTLDTMVFTNYPAPSVANGGADKIICFDETTVTLTGIVPLSGKGSWTWKSGPNIPVPGLSNEVAEDTSLNGLLTGIYVYQYRVNTNAACVASTDNIQIIKLAKANAGADFRVCNVATIYLDANVPLLGHGSWSYTSGPLAPGAILFSNIEDPRAYVSGLVAGTYIFRWTVPATDTCSLSFDEVQVTIDPPVPANYIGSQQSFCQGSGTPFTIGPNPSGGINYHWSPAALLSNPDIAQPTFEGINNSGNFIYTLKSTIGSCATYATARIDVKPIPIANIQITNGSCSATFIATPPGSGVNDPLYNWNFSSNANPAAASGRGPHQVTFLNSGTRNILLDIISADGCINSASISYDPLCSLPVKLVSFDAAWKNNYALISWDVASAINLNRFELERSYDGIIFQSLYETAYDNSKQRYNFADHTIDNISNNGFFYRLKMIDNDDAFSYSEIKAIKLSENDYAAIWPNPFIDRINVRLTHPDLPGFMFIKIYNAAGEILRNKKITFVQRGDIAEIENLGGLAPGMYVLQIVAKGKKVLNYKIIKRFN